MGDHEPGGFMRWFSSGKRSSLRRTRERRASMTSTTSGRQGRMSRSTSTTSLNGDEKCLECGVPFNGSENLTLSDGHPRELRPLCLQCTAASTDASNSGSSEPSLHGPKKDANTRASSEQDISLISKSTSNSADLDQVLLGLLECPVCYQPLTPPVRQCANGHCVCSPCHHKLVSCPTCRGCFLASSNVALNAIAGAVRLPCRYRAAGCGARLRMAEKALHEAACSHREYHCPTGTCAWKGYMKDLLQHTLDEHVQNQGAVPVSLNHYVEMSYTYSRTKPFEISQAKGGVNNVARSVLLVEGSQAVALLVFHLRFDTARTLLHAVLQLVGPPPLAHILSYKVSWRSNDGEFRLSGWSAVSLQSVEEALAGGRVLRVDGEAFKHFLSPEGKFRVRLKLVANRLPIK